MARESDGFVRAVARGLAVVEALGRPPGRHTLAEVARAAGLSRAAARRVLATLVALHYCRADGRHFRLRLRALALGLSYFTAHPFWGTAQHLVADLRDELGEACALVQLDGDEIVYLSCQPARHGLAAGLGIGSRLPAHLTAPGWVLLAALPAEAREAYLARADLRRPMPAAVAGADALRDALALVAAQGHAWVLGEIDPVTCGMAVPVRDHTGDVVAALGVSTLDLSAYEAEAKRRYLQPLHRIAATLRLQGATLP